MSASPGWTWQMPNMSEDGWILQKQDQIGLERFARWSDEYKCFLSNNTKGKLCKSPSDHLVWREVRFDWFQNIQGLMSPVMIFRHICLDIEVKYRFLERTDGRVQGRTWGPSGAKIQTWKKKLKYFLYILYLSKKEKKWVIIPWRCNTCGAVKCLHGGRCQESLRSPRFPLDITHLLIYLTNSGEFLSSYI